MYIDEVATSVGTFVLQRECKLSIRCVTELIGIHYNTYTNWKKSTNDKRKGASHENNRYYTDEEVGRAKEAILKYPDMTIPQIQAMYLDDFSTYLGSVRWLYNLQQSMIVKNNWLTSGKSSDSRKLSRRADIATGPNQVWVWDITYLYSSINGQYYYLYSIMDLYSRYIVHNEVHIEQTAELAAQCIQNAVNKQRIALKRNKVNVVGVNELVDGRQLVLHSDNGAPMTGQTMIAACIDLGIQCTYSRPRHSNDNAHMEASFKLLKHNGIVEIPQCFSSVEHARSWCEDCYQWYNNEHRHSGICYITPAKCYQGEGAMIMEKRNCIINEFYAEHQESAKLRGNAGGKRSHKKAMVWEMPKQVEIMPFYVKRSIVKTNIRNGDYTGYY